jgi:uncharacterized cupredoxin-like copper-binding protein
MKIKLTPLTVTLLCATSLSSAAFAHGDKEHAAKPRSISKDQHDWGKEGNLKLAKRTIMVDMKDTMRFSPDALNIKQGETVKFIFRNTGSVVHEWVLGTPDELAKHSEVMKKFPDMEHDAPYMVHVKPNAKGELAWTFNKAGRFSFGCLIPGHWEAGMKGSITVQPSTKG